MENVYFYVAIAAFVLAAVLAVAAVVVFVKMDVINAIRFLQGKDSDRQHGQRHDERQKPRRQTLVGRLFHGQYPPFQ